MSGLRLNNFVFGLQLCAIAFSFTHCNARRSTHLRGHNKLSLKNSNIQKSTKKITVSKNLNLYDALMDEVSSNTGPHGVGSTFTISPYDSLPSVSWPDQNTPPFCVNPPFMPLPPPSSSSNPTPTIPFPNPPLGPPVPNTGSSPSNPGTGPTPTLPFPNPPLGPGGPNTSPSPSNPSPSPSNPNIGSNPPGSNPSPNPNPPIIVPSPPTLIPSPNYEPSSPTIVIPGPPSNYSPPSIFVPSPPVFQPPVVYPPPTGPPPPKATHNGALWCVAKPAVPDPIIQEAMNYACGSGGDCESIQANGVCFQPDTLYAHASYAFNSYWQRTKVAGGTCDFGSTAMLVTVDPSYDSCHFVLL